MATVREYLVLHAFNYRDEATGIDTFISRDNQHLVKVLPEAIIRHALERQHVTPYDVPEDQAIEVAEDDVPWLNPAPAIDESVPLRSEIKPRRTPMAAGVIPAKAKSPKAVEIKREG